MMLKAVLDLRQLSGPRKTFIQSQWKHCEVENNSGKEAEKGFDFFKSWSSVRLQPLVFSLEFKDWHLQWGEPTKNLGGQKIGPFLSTGQKKQIIFIFLYRSELREVEVRMCVQPNSPIIILILLNGFHKFAMSIRANTAVGLHGEMSHSDWHWQKDKRQKLEAKLTSDVIVRTSITEHKNLSNCNLWAMFCN